MADAVGTRSRRSSRTRSSRSSTSRQPALKGKPTNVEGLLFKEQEAGYLVGYLAGLYAKDNNDRRRSRSSAARRSRRSTTTSPATRRARRPPNPTIKTLNGYSQDFVDQAKCKEIALNQIQQGSAVVFAVAGQCGLGALDAAKQSKGCRASASTPTSRSSARHVLTSATKKVDVAVFDTIKAVQAGTFKGGTDQTFDVNNGGVGRRQDQRGRRRSTQSQIDAVQKKIAAGEITPPQEPSK